MHGRDHHDWASEAYVDEWVREQEGEDPIRAWRFQLMCDLFPFGRDAAVTILDVGAGYGAVSAFILERYAHATCVAQDGSSPMLDRARARGAKYGERFQTHQSDLFDTGWLPDRFGPFDAVVSSSCLHNLRDFERISRIYRDIREHLKAGGVFLNLDLVNAPTPELARRYERVPARRASDSGATEDLARSWRRSTEPGSVGPFPADLEQQMAALKAAGFRDVDCFWKELRRALIGGSA